MTLDEWESACSMIAKADLCLVDLWADDDPYELAEMASDAFDLGQTPKQFVETVFEEDYARLEHDALLVRESLEYE